MDIVLSLMGQLTVFQDIDGDIGGAYARVSLHPTGPCKIADPLNVERCRGRYRRRKDAEHRGAREAVSDVYGAGPRTVFNQLANRYTCKKKETRYTTVRKEESEREKERERKRKRKRGTQ